MVIKEDRPSQLSSSIFLWIRDLRKQLGMVTFFFFFTAGMTTIFEYGEIVRNSENLKTQSPFQN